MLEKLLLNLLNIPSETGSEQAICDYIKNYLKKFKKFELNQKGKTLCYFSKNIDNKKAIIAFYGHLDTVKNKQTFSNSIDGDFIYGCGASDMKSGVTVIMALMQLIEETDSTAYNYQFIFYDGEEGSYSQSGLNKIFEYEKRLKLPKIAFVLEPTNNSIQAGCLGVIKANVSFNGRSGHSARPWEAENAIHKSWKLIKMLQELKPKKVTTQELDFYEVLTATMVRGGEVPNVIPDKITFLLNYRYAPNVSMLEAEQNLKNLLANKVDQINILENSPSCKVRLQNVILKELISKFELQIKPKQAWTDIARLDLEIIDAVNLGPGDPREAHQKNEKISISALQQCFKIYKELILTKKK